MGGYQPPSTTYQVASLGLRVPDQGTMDELAELARPSLAEMDPVGLEPLGMAVAVLIPVSDHQLRPLLRDRTDDECDHNMRRAPTA